MCGLSGEINFDGRSAEAGALQRMTDALSPRGPDGSGLVLRGPVGLGHRRRHHRHPEGQHRRSTRRPPLQPAGVRRCRRRSGT